MEKLKIGVVGLGLMGEVHTMVYKSLPNVQVVGCVETLPERAREFEDKLGVKVYTNLDDLLPQIDALSICTPDNMHKDIIIKAFEAGVKCLVEKPLEVSSEACEEIIAKMPDPTYLMVGHILRFDSRVWRAKQALESGELGKIYSVNICRSNSMASGWKIGKRTSVTWFLGIHDVDLLLWLTGKKVKRVSAMGKKVFTPYWDYVVSTMELEDGIIACVENGWTMPVQRVTGLDAAIKIIGEKGMMEVNLTHNDARITTVDRGRSMLLDTYHWPSNNDTLYGDLRLEIEAFVDAVINNKVPPVTAEEAKEAVKVVEWIEKMLDEQ